MAEATASIADDLDAGGVIGIEDVCRSLALSLILLAFMAIRAHTVARALMPLFLASSFAYVVLEIRFLISFMPVDLGEARWVCREHLSQFLLS